MRGDFNVADYGAAGDGQTLDTRAIQAAIDACGLAGGGTVYLRAGNYVTGSIFLRSHVTLHIDGGAALLGNENAVDYPVLRSWWEGVEQDTHAPLISGNDLKNIAVIGRGTVDGRGAPWWKMLREKTLKHPRPRLISFANCTNVLIEGLTLANSPSWTIHPVRCENVTVDKVTIINPADSPNTDGINPDSCRNVHISNCHIDVGDDCITIKSGKEDAGRANLSPCENITITNCTMMHGHGGVVIGSEMSGDVRNVVVSNCIFTGTDRGIRLKSRRERGGIVEDIRVSNIVMQDVLCPFTMNLYYHVGVRGNQQISDKGLKQVTEGTPRFRRIHISHITARDAHYAAGFLFGLPEMPLEDISFSDISISMSADAGPGAPDMADDVEPMQRAGFFVRNARGLRFHNVQVTGQVGPAFTLVDARNVDISACTTRTPAPDAPIIRMRNIDGAFVHDCYAHAESEAFLELQGESTRAVVLHGNNLARARQAINFAANARRDVVRIV